ncbi:apses-domain-containing protein [Cylindrobasidium torrendii FP15055 ss-10]|uniref:Apses-domain-containing protein n=1 Tax=Cylindrobasidium torrendii FP15055 ss-10 TaxID=1314674 RepID=A0A0D7BKE9_9AGAR|nr:apses-domain-containing protein [Cylindrobasidium torrendii FP15055 ss-10]
MQAGRPVANQPAVKIYNAVYSSVQVYECMIRGIAVMRRRTDSYVNATQILKVAGVDKGRRTKILEKEILPGKHEIVQGGYGKYQGTWIPLDRGRDISMQYGVAPLLAPLFDFQPSTHTLGALPVGAPSIAGSPRPLSAAGSYGTLPPNYFGGGQPPPIMPGSALRLLNQGRAQGLFTPSSSSFAVNRPPSNPYSRSPYSQTPPPIQPTPQASLKRTRSDDAGADVVMGDVTEGPGTNSEDIPSAPKRARTGLTPEPSVGDRYAVETTPRLATKPSIPRNIDPTIPLKDTRRAAIVTAVCQSDDPTTVLNILRDVSGQDVDTIIDDQGHTALHLAAALSRMNTVALLISQGADIHRGNHLGETALMRTILSTHCYDAQSMQQLLGFGLAKSILTLDTSRKSVLHHIVAIAGVKGRAPIARYYLDQIVLWIAEKEKGDFSKIIDLQDEHGDTALNVAARVGSRSLVRTLVDIGANKTLLNKLGLRAGDFGVESEELNPNNKQEDLLASLRSTASLPVQKGQDVIADMKDMINGLTQEFQVEIKSKQDSLDVTQAHLRAATRELSEQRKHIQIWQAKCAELDMVAQRARNVDRALVEEVQFDWTGRGGDDTDPAAESKNPAFRFRGLSSTMVGTQAPSIAIDADPIIPQTNDLQSLIRLRRIKMWNDRMTEIVANRMKGLKGASAEKEFMCRKIVALCTGVPVDKVEEMLESLVAAVESEDQVVDINRVSGFMQKVREGIL